MTHTLRAEMAATVLAVLEVEGATVGPDTMIVLLESMKMEIPVLAEVAGVVREVVVAAGDGLQDGDVIAVIDER